MQTANEALLVWSHDTYCPGDVLTAGLWTPDWALWHTSGSSSNRGGRRWKAKQLSRL